MLTKSKIKFLGGGGHKKIKKAFTLVELSVVIVIISIMLSTVLVSKSLINSTKINKIYEEYRTFNNSIKMFYDTYDCLPGDCTQQMIPDLVSSGLNTACVTTNSTVVSVGGAYDVQTIIGSSFIESATKRTCLMHSLQLAKYITGVDTSYSQLGDSVAGKNIPYAKFDKMGAWDAGNYYGTPNTRILVPNAIAIGSLGHFWGKNSLILRNANTATGSRNDLAIVPGVGVNLATYAVSSKLANNLDLKFDDGLPYSGSIASDRNYTNGSLLNCTNNSGNSYTAANITTNVQYLKSNDLNSGCIVVFLLTT